MLWVINDNPVLQYCAQQWHDNSVLHILCSNLYSTFNLLILRHFDAYWRMHLINNWDTILNNLKPDYYSFHLICLYSSNSCQFVMGFTKWVTLKVLNFRCWRPVKYFNGFIDCWLLSKGFLKMYCDRLDTSTLRFKVTANTKIVTMGFWCWLKISGDYY